MPDILQPLLTARGLTVVRRIDDRDVTLVDAVDIDLAAGELVDLTGPSGSGKTTLLLSLARLFPSATGSLTLAGVPSARIDPARWRARVAYLPQRPVLVPGSVADNLLVPFGLAVHRGRSDRPSPEALRDAADGVGLTDVALDRPAERLSVGQGARVALLRTLLTAPDVLLLDEPDASLDDDSARMVSEATERFAAAGGAVMRVRHGRVDSNAARRFRLDGGHVGEVAR